MKHAYLILAHNEFDILKRLITALDDERNDIFIHIDRKVYRFPNLAAGFAGLYILEDRIDVRWGDVSMVRAELMLFEIAQQQGSYDYYHLLSGVDMPLRSQDEIHAFFQQNSGKQFIGFSMADQSQITRRVGRYHLFARHFRQKDEISHSIKKSIRFVVLRLQFLVGIQRNKRMEFKKGTQWVSLTQPFVSYLLTQKEDILEMYKMTFCSDEIFVQTACWNSSFRTDIYDLETEKEGSQRLIRWENNVLHDWGNDDLNELISSGCMFARKFNSAQMEVVDQLLARIISSQNKN